MPKDVKMQEELKRIRELEEANKTAAYRQKLMNERMANRAAERDEVREKLFSETDSKGNKINVWDKVMHDANTVINKEFTTINDWRNAMLSLLQMFTTLVKAVDGSLSGNVRQPLKELLVDQGLLGVVYDKGLVGAVKGIKHLVSGDEPVSLPSLVRHIELTDDDRFKIHKLVRSDNIREMGKLDVLFEKVFYKFLEEEEHCWPDSEEEGILRDENGNRVGRARLESILEKFGEYLKETSDLNFIPGGPG